MTHLGNTGKISAIFRDGQIELKDGTPFPAMENNTPVDIIVPIQGFKDDKDRIKYTLEQQKIFFPPRTELWVNLPSSGSKLLNERSTYPDIVLGAKFRSGLATKIRIEEPLILMTQGTTRGKLKNCRVSIPLLKGEAKSLNQAFTLLSRVYEPDRLSHTGNVFRNIYFEDTGEMLPLSKRRDLFLSGGMEPVNSRVLFE